MTTVGCVLEAHHKIGEQGAVNLDTPAGRQQLIEWGNAHQRARIVSFQLTQKEAEMIRDRLWPDENLLGATSGKGFAIETAEEVGVINEILGPRIHIQHSQEHEWRLQTW